MSVDEARFCKVWEEAEFALRAFVRMLCPRDCDIEDIIQDTALTAFEKFASFDESKSSFATWVRGIAKYEVLNRRRSHARSKIVFSSETVDLLSETIEEEEAQADTAEQVTALKQCMASLPDDQRQLLELKYVQGLSSDEIGEKIGISPGNARIRLMRLRDTLFERLQHLGLTAMPSGL